MCIRDRFTDQHRVVLGAALQHLDRAAYFVIAPDHRIQLAPVSYTHLRAHETVLDLVCRLLLEKKKTH